METSKISIFAVIGDTLAVEADEGQKVYNQIKKALGNGNNVILSFLNVEIVTTAFLNTAVGQLLKDHTEEEIKQRMSVEDMSEPGKASLYRVIETAKLFYKDPEALKRSIDEIMGD